MAAQAPHEIDSDLIRRLIEREERRLEEHTRRSFELYQTAKDNLVAGVSSGYQAREPYPIYFTEGHGSKILTLDGEELSDFHNAYGCMVQGHAHPVIVETIRERVRQGHPVRPRRRQDAVVVARHLAENFKLPKWRFVNSGSEATMDAIRVARAFTGRDTDPQDLRLLPRAPRLRHGLDADELRRDRAARRLHLGCPTAAASRRPSST